jgi:hypothetical protein
MSAGRPTRHSAVGDATMARATAAVKPVQEAVKSIPDDVMAME